MMLALVPTADVPDVFNQLVENITDTVQIDPLLSYFERTWIAGLNGRAVRYPPASWNQTDRVETNLNRTNNYCERTIQKSHLCVLLSLCRHSVHLLGDCRLSVHHPSVHRPSVHHPSVHRLSVHRPSVLYPRRHK